ncbi:unnamed protein product [Danaus chrysippus]|uniref:(African queen) hypothetical protein n=1 Tax=Danaus chrysippus TaxID=151541 RepID=A0A8J2R510_9NEOP|nr:unnamed protein product [Danaus chrysippus]
MSVCVRYQRCLCRPHAHLSRRQFRRYVLTYNISTVWSNETPLGPTERSSPPGPSVRRFAGPGAATPLVLDICPSPTVSGSRRCRCVIDNPKVCYQTRRGERAFRLLKITRDRGLNGEYRPRRVSTGCSLTH